MSHATRFILVLIAAGPLFGCSTLFGPSDEERARADRELIQAIEVGDLDAARERLAEGADPEARTSRATGGTALTALQLAVVLGRHSAAELLLEEGADPRATEPTIGTTLHLAALYSDVAMVKLLVEHGADVDSLDATGAQSPLQVARRTGKTDIEQYLLECGAQDFTAAE